MQINNQMSAPECFSSSALTRQALIDILPLSLAVIPWGILCGSLAIEAGMSAWQAQLMSLLVFAGAAQLSASNLIGAGVALPSLLNSTLMISARHLLYSATYAKHIRHLPLIKRAAFAFFLTDEMFAVASAHQEKHQFFSYRYALVSGVAFYVVWNLATLAGIVFAKSLDINAMGLDFAIAVISVWILLMAGITFAVRYAFFARSLPIKLNRHARQFLMFTAPCVLTAMWTPIVFVDSLQQSNLLNPYLLAGLFAVVASLLIRHTLVVIGLSMLVFYLLRGLL